MWLVLPIGTPRNRGGDGHGAGGLGGEAPPLALSRRTSAAGYESSPGVPFSSPRSPAGPAGGAAPVFTWVAGGAGIARVRRPRDGDHGGHVGRRRPVRRARGPGTVTVRPAGRVHDGHDRDEHPPPQRGAQPRQTRPRLPVLAGGGARGPRRPADGGGAAFRRRPGRND